MSDELELLNEDDLAQTLQSDCDIRAEEEVNGLVRTSTETTDTGPHNQYNHTITSMTPMSCNYTISDSHYQQIHPVVLYDNQTYSDSNKANADLFNNLEHQYWDTDSLLQMSSMTIPISSASQFYTQHQQEYHTSHNAGTHQAYPIAVAMMPSITVEENRRQTSSDKSILQPQIYQNKVENQNPSKSTPVISDIENATDLVDVKTSKRRRKRRRKHAATMPLDHWSASSWQESSCSPISINRALHNEIERRRRHRIAECCDALKKLVPGLSSKTDKATVLEQTVKFVRHSFDCPNKCNCEFVI